MKKIIQSNNSKIILASIIVLLASWGLTQAGALTPSSTPAPTFYTLNDLYNRLSTGATTTAGSHSLSTSSVPVASMHTLTEIYNLIPDMLSLSAATTSVPRGIYGTTTLNGVDTDLAAANIKSGTTIFGITGSYSGGGGSSATPLKTNQTNCYDPTGNTTATTSCAGTGQDGELQKGVALSYTDNSNGTVTDNSTGLVWQKAGDALNDTFENALTYCNSNTAALSGTGWRLPNLRELLSIVDYSRGNPSINPAFTNTQSDLYWSSTTYQAPGSEDFAWLVYFFDGGTSNGDKLSSYYVRCVRG